MTAARHLARAAVVDALARAGLFPAGIHPLRDLPDPPPPRATFRVDLVSGGTVKVRRMDSAESARRQHAFRAVLPPPFTRVLARVDAFLIEEWVDGQPLTDPRPSHRLVQAAGRLLATLHATPPPPVRSAPRGRLDWVADTRTGLSRLRAAGVLDDAVAATLDAIIGAGPADRSPLRLVHNDFCGENMVVTPVGGLAVVDNEHMAIDAPGLDLARCWYRWGLPDEGWTWFCDAYRAGGGTDEAFAHQPFWRVAGTVISACLRLRGSPAELDRPLARLREIARTGRGKEGT